MSDKWFHSDPNGLFNPARNAIAEINTTIWTWRGNVYQKMNDVFPTHQYKTIYDWGGDIRGKFFDLCYKLNSLKDPSHANAPLSNRMAYLPRVADDRIPYTDSECWQRANTSNKVEGYWVFDTGYGYGPVGIFGWGATWRHNYIRGAVIIFQLKEFSGGNDLRNSNMGSLMGHEMGHSLGRSRTHDPAEVNSPNIMESGVDDWTSNDAYWAAQRYMDHKYN